MRRERSNKHQKNGKSIFNDFKKITKIDINKKKSNSKLRTLKNVQYLLTFSLFLFFASFSNIFLFFFQRDKNDMGLCG